MKKLLMLIALALIFCSGTFAAEFKKPSPTDKCPVCGMFVAKYPDFLGQVIFKGGSYAFFDGAKDMFKYLFALTKYDPSKKAEEIESIYVTDYYSLDPTDGKEAYYVVGSNVLGPMGRELIPFEKKEEAEEFLSDHAGLKILRYGEVTPEVIRTLD